MRYTIMGFSQAKLVEYGLDTIDATLLRYFVDFKESKRMKLEVVEGKAYFWLQYDGVLKDLPILKMKKGTVQSRFFKMRDAGILTHHVKRQGGTYSYFGLGEKCFQLIGSQEVASEFKEKVDFEDGNGESQGNDASEAMDNNQQSMDGDQQCMDENQGGYQLKSTTKYSSTRDSSTNNNNVVEEAVIEIVDYLNTSTGKHFKSSTKETVKLIKARMKDGFNIEDFKMVIDNMKANWTGTRFQQYLAPTTLFGAKFEAYLNTGRNQLQSESKRGNVSSYNSSSEDLKDGEINLILKEDM